MPTCVASNCPSVLHQTELLSDYGVGVRVEETSVHQALREALVNTLIHADYTGQVSVLIMKRPDMFGFRNPGTMRMPVETAVRGGVSDCRNRRLQGMFRYVGLGEQAGSGLPKIYTSWRQQEWRAPELTEETPPYEQTVFQLRMASLVPSETMAMLERRFGTGFRQLPEIQRLAMVTVALEKSVTHGRLGSMTDAHSRDVTLALFSLVQRGMLESSGQHKRTFYFFPGERPAKKPALGFLEEGGAGSEAQATGGADRGGFGADRGGLEADRGGVEADRGGLREHLPPEHRRLLESLGKRPRRSALRAAIEQLCSWRPLRPSELAGLLGLRPENLVWRHLGPMAEEGRLERTHPENPSHPAQAYRAKTAPGALDVCKGKRN